jgi:hypothetical protein
VSEQGAEPTDGARDDDPRTGALPGGGDSQYGNDTGFADEALADEGDAPTPGNAEHGDGT